MLMNGLNLFPLSKIDRYMEGYHMAVGGEIFSTRGNAKGLPTRLAGSSTGSGRYFVLNKRSFRHDALIHMAKKHKDWAQDTAMPAPPTAWPLPTPGVAQKSTGNCLAGQVGRTKSATEATKEKGFLLATVGPTDKFVFSTDPVMHLHRATAVAEAERIATLKPGTKVVVLQIVASVVVGGARWE